MSHWEPMRQIAQQMHEAREKVLLQTRKLGQMSAKSIRHVHRGELSQAQALIEGAKEEAKQIREILRMNTLLNPTYLHDTEKELVEAAAVLAIARNEPLPQMDLVTASVMTYLHGVCEAASEVRRLVLDALRRGEMTRALEILERMEQIYEELITFDFPDSLTHGLRRSVDALRAVLERTRSDVTLTTCQERLAEKLNTIQKAN